MIIDRVEYASEYAATLPHLQDALDFISANPEPGEGKHEFPGGYLMYQTGMTREPAGAYETHKKYIDVQILKEGDEIIFWNRLENMTVTEEYNETKDKLTVDGEGSVLELKSGMFCVLYPSDAHKACRHLDGMAATEFKKYVVKLEM